MIGLLVNACQRARTSICGAGYRLTIRRYLRHGLMSRPVLSTRTTGSLDTKGSALNCAEKALFWPEKQTSQQCMNDVTNELTLNEVQYNSHMGPTDTDRLDRFFNKGRSCIEHACVLA